MSISKKPNLLGTGHPDHFQTPKHALDDLIPYLKKEWRIWEPAAGKGNLVEGLDTLGFRCFGTDIIYTGEYYLDFLSGEPPYSFDAIISNPPFSRKHQFLARALALGKPFAFLLPITVFDSKERRKLFHENNMQFIMPDGRYSFETPNNRGSSAWFFTCWVTWGLKLPAMIVYRGFEEQPTFKELKNARKRKTAPIHGGECPPPCHDAA